MGCICSKGTFVHEYAENCVTNKGSKKSSTQVVASPRGKEVVIDVNNSGNVSTAKNLVSASLALDDWEKKAMATAKKNASPHTALTQEGTREEEQISRVFSVSNGVDGAQVAAGWPLWLTSVAGEAIQGWVPRKADSFEKLEKVRFQNSVTQPAEIGQGTYSSVYRARDLETGKLVALKKVRFVNKDPESVRFMAREIRILRQLDHPNVMKLEGLVILRVSGTLYLVFEYMEHDLAGLTASPKVKFTEPQIKCYMQQLFCGLEHCHSHGVLHRDIKGSNLLIDDNGNLKIGDFGLATFFSPNSKQPLTFRVVTLWYRPPELLLGATDYGVAVDLWSAGCILAELYARKPIMPGRTEVEQLHKIFKLCGSPAEEYWQRSRLPNATIFKPQQPYRRCIAETFKDFPPSALGLLDALLALEPNARGSASSALQSEFFTTKPLPCDPSSLPKYPPSKELDMKIHDEKARRQKTAVGSGGHAHESNTKDYKESQRVPTPDANSEVWHRLQRPQGQYPGQPPSSPKSGTVLRTKEAFRHPRLADLSLFSNSVAVRGSSRLDMSQQASRNQHWPEERCNAKYDQLDYAGSSVSYDWPHRSHDVSKSCGKNESVHEKGSTAAYAPNNHRNHYSGPLLHTGRNVDEMLKEHERRIQDAVRKACLNKTKSKDVLRK